MTLFELNGQLKELLGGRAALARLGFEEEQIFTTIARSRLCDCPKPHLMIMLVAQGSRFFYDCGPTDLDLDDEMGLAKYVGPAFDAWNASSQEARDEIFQGSMAVRDSSAFAMALVSKGITPPKRLH